MKTLQILLLLCMAGTAAHAQNMLTVNDIMFADKHYNTSYLATDSNQINASTVFHASNASEKYNRLHLLIDANIAKYGLGIGGKVNTKFQNTLQTTTAELLLAKQIKIKEKSTISLGVNTGVLLYSVNQNRFNEFTDLEDPILLNNDYNKVQFTSGFGFNYTYNRAFTLGFTMPMLANSITGVNSVYIANTSYLFDVKNQQKYFVEPKLQVYGNNFKSNTTLQGSLKFKYKENVWAQMGMRSTKTVFFGAGGGYQFIQLGYLYSMNTIDGNLNSVLAAKHSIYANVKFLNIKK